MSLNKILRYVNKEDQNSFLVDFYDLLASFSDSQIPNIDHFQYSKDVIDACAWAYEVNADDVVNNKKRSRQINSAKLQAAFFMSRLDREYDWASARLGVKRSSFVYRKKTFQNLFETDPIFRSYFTKIYTRLKDKGYQMQIP